MTNTKTYLGSSYVYGLVIGLLILIFGLKIFETQKPTENTEILLKTVSIPDLSKQPAVIPGGSVNDYCNNPARTDDNVNDINAEQYFSGGKANNTKANSKMKIKRYNIKLV